MSAWTDHVAKWKDCQLCPLAQQRFRICIARGAVPADVLFVGEAPGASEDAIGRPFVGPAGGLLDQIIERSLPEGVTYALTNLVCCFPKEAKAEGINEPHQTEVASCRPRLIEFVNIVQPRLIVCVGAMAAEYVDHADTVECIDIIHPAAILRKNMPLVQKNMAAQKVVVVLRSAVLRVLGQERKPFTKWGEKYASRKAHTKRERVRADYEAWAGDPSPTRGTSRSDGWNSASGSHR